MKLQKKIHDYKVLGAILPILLIIIWEVLSQFGYINGSVLPAPSKLLTTLITIISDGSLAKNVCMSLKRVISGYALGASLGILIGVALGLSPLIKRLLSVILEVFRPIPILAWVPVLILWSGIGERSKIITIAIGSFWSVLLNTADGVRNVDAKYKEVAAIFTKNKFDTIFSVMLPAALPSIFTGLRLGIGSAWLSVVGAEMVAASSGLGYFISYNREMMKPAKMYVGVFTIGIIGWLINVLIRKIEAFVLKWHVGVKE